MGMGARKNQSVIPDVVKYFGFNSSAGYADD